MNSERWTVMEWWRRLRMLTSRRWRRELREEMRLHRELRGDDRRFGNELRLLERSRAAWGWTWVETWGQDLRQGVRRLRRTPLVTALALVSLGLGMGATMALFSLADAVILRPLPVAHAGGLAILEKPQAGAPGGLWPYFSNALYEALSQQSGIFDRTFAIGTMLVGLQGSPSLIRVDLASGEYFPALGIAAQQGRLLGPSDDIRGCAGRAVISDSFWQHHFGRSEAALGSVLTIHGKGFEVVGVAPASFQGMEVGSSFDLVAPLCDEPLLRGKQSLLEARNGGWLVIFARRTRGESPAQAQVRLEAARQALLPAIPQDERSAFHVRLEPGAQGLSRLRQREAAPLWILLAVAGMVWLLACSNLAALLWARAEARRPEMAVRAALGASRSRLARAALTESLLLTVGGALGAGLPAAWGCKAAVQFWSEPGLPLDLNLQPDGRVMTMAAVLVLATALLMSLAATWRLARAPRRSFSHPAAPLGRQLLAGQMAVSLLLLAAAGIFARSLARLTGPAKGFDASNVWIAGDNYGAPAGLNPATLQRLRDLPGVAAAGASAVVPVQGSSWGGRVSREGTDSDFVLMNAVTPGYFAALRTPIVEGRDLQLNDTGRGVVVVNQELARRLFPGTPAVGQTVRVEARRQEVREVVGVVANSKYVNLRTPSPPTAYLPMPPDQYVDAHVEIRSRLPFAEAEQQLRAALPPGTPLQTFDELMNSGIRPERLLVWVAGLFGGLSLVLAAIGLYGVTLYNAGRRRREFAIRLALGAEARTISGLMAREAATTLAWSLALGLGMSWAAARIAAAQLGSLLYDTSAGDAGAWVAAVAVLGLAAVLASWLPARGAGRADPMLALREE